MSGQFWNFCEQRDPSSNFAQCELLEGATREDSEPDPCKKCVETKSAQILEVSSRLFDNWNKLILQIRLPPRKSQPATGNCAIGLLN